MNAEVHWTDRASFAEVAETLEVTTEHILGAVESRIGITVMWTPDLSDLGSAMTAFLKRDAYDILQVTRGPDPVPGNIIEQIRKSLGLQ